MSQKVDASKYVWVITERGKDYENFLGLQDETGDRFIPVCAEKEQALILSGRLPNPEGVQRNVEAMHREEIGQQATSEGYSLYLVDDSGRILERLAGPAAN